MRIHGLCKILRKMDILQEVLSFAHKRSLSKYSEIDHEEDFFETGEAPDIHREWGFFGIVGEEGVCGWEGLHGELCYGGGLAWMISKFQSKLFQDFRSWLLRDHTVPLWDGSNCPNCLRSPPVCAFLSLPSAKTHQKPEIKSPSFSQVKVTDLFHRLVRTAPGTGISRGSSRLLLLPCMLCLPGFLPPAASSPCLQQFCKEEQQEEGWDLCL